MVKLKMATNLKLLRMNLIIRPWEGSKPLRSLDKTMLQLKSRHKIQLPKIFTAYRTNWPITKLQEDAS